MKILYIGQDVPSSTSFHRASALTRLGHHVIIKNPYLYCKEELNNVIFAKLHYFTGYYFLQNKIRKWVFNFLSNDTVYDLIWINSGELIGSRSLKLLKEIGCPVILYNNDDPTGKRDGNRFKTLLSAIKYYDLCVVRQEKNKQEYTTYGVKNILKVMMSYDEVAHENYKDISEIENKFISDIAFVGTWIRGEKRDEFILKLIENGLNVSIWGNRWSKSPYWNVLSKYHRGNALSGKDYVAAIQGSKISLGFLSKGNGDLHTRRSVEIPFSGGLLCAERTVIHQEMFIEGGEAVFWDNADECITICKKMLADYNLRERIRLAGMKKVLELKVGNEDICRKILLEVDKIKKSTF
jgi:spore maturation protein CgeB